MEQPPVLPLVPLELLVEPLLEEVELLVEPLLLEELLVLLVPLVPPLDVSTTSPLVEPPLVPPVSVVFVPREPVPGSTAPPQAVPTADVRRIERKRREASRRSMVAPQAKRVPCPRGPLLPFLPRDRRDRRVPACVIDGRARRGRGSSSASRRAETS